MHFTKYCVAGKDYVYLSDSNAYFDIEKADAKRLCDRHLGIGADGIFAVYQNFPKNGQIRGFLSNGEIMRDFSTAAVCAAFALNSEKSFKEYEFQCDDRGIFTVISDLDNGYPVISCDMGKADDSYNFSAINRKTEIGNRILTLTAVFLHSVHTVHFSEDKNRLDINYLGKVLSSNSLFNKKANLILAEKTSKNSFNADYYENKTGNPRPTLSAFAATALAACKTGNADYGEEIRVTSNNSTVYVFCKEDGSAVIQSTAVKIFDGFILQ